MRHILIIFLVLGCFASAFAQKHDVDDISIPLEMTINTINNPFLNNLALEELSIFTFGSILYKTDLISKLNTEVQGLFTPYLRKQMMLSQNNILNENRLVNFQLKLKSVYKYNSKIVIVAQLQGRYGLAFGNTHTNSESLFSKNLEAYLDESCGGCGITYPAQGSGGDFKASLGVGNSKSTLRVYYQYDQQNSDIINRLEKWSSLSYSEDLELTRHTGGVEVSRKMPSVELFVRGETGYTEGKLELINHIDDKSEVETVNFSYLPTLRFGLKFNLQKK
jgi:hypothetical protein